jgi:putative hydrolase of HD superfamily
MFDYLAKFAILFKRKVMDQGKINKLLDFLKEIDKLKMVYRYINLSDNSRKESTAEHTWHVCMIALLLYKEISTKIDICHALKIILVHDLVEIYAGDTFAFDFEGHKDKKEREEAAAKKLFGFLPEDSQNEFYALWHEYEAKKTPESRFAKAVDKMHAVSQNIFSSGSSWKENGVTEEMSRKRNAQAMAFDPVFKAVYDVLYQRAKDEKMWPENK